MNQPNTRRLAVHLTVNDVGCPGCGSQKHEPCISKEDGAVLKRFHPERFAELQRLLDRANGSSGTARWARWKLRHDGAPQVAPLHGPPHGTMAGWRRHKKEGNEPCQRCLDAAREVWRHEHHLKVARRKAQQ